MRRRDFWFRAWALAASLSLLGCAALQTALSPPTPTPPPSETPSPAPSPTSTPTDEPTASPTATLRPQSTSTWDRYVPRTLAEMLALAQEEVGELEDKHIYLEISPDYQYPSRVEVTYTGEFRPILETRHMMTVAWLNAVGSGLSQKEKEALFQQEGRFLEGEDEYWLPVQTPLLPDFEEYAQPGGRVRLLVVFLGAWREGGATDWVIIVNAFKELD